MNNRTLARARDTLYARMASLVVQSVARFFGLPITAELLEQVRATTQPVVSTTRESVRSLVYRDYVQVIDNSQPVEPLQLNRFTDELWAASIEKAAEDHEVFNDSVVEQIGLSADYWSRDAEWGQAVDVSKKDDRVGRIARVDPVPPTCPLCTLMNSRGPVYVSEESFVRTLHTGDTCEPVFVLAGSDDYPGREHTELALERYKKARRSAPNGSADAILKALKEQEPDRPPSRVRTEVRTAVTSAKKDQARQIRSRIESLERTNPTTGRARQLRDEQLTRDRATLSALEAD
jgi:hypothetical protein